MNDTYNANLTRCEDVVYTVETPVPCEYPYFVGIWAATNKSYSCSDRMIMHDLLGDAPAQMRMVKILIVLVGALFNWIHFFRFTFPRLKSKPRKKLDVLDNISLLNIHISFWLLVRAFDYRGYNDTYSFKLEVCFSGFINMSFFTMILLLVEAWTAVLHMSKFSPGQQKSQRKKRRQIFWFTMLCFVASNIVVNFLDAFGMLQDCPPYMRGMEKMAKISTGVAFQIGLNIVVICGYVANAKINVRSITRSLLKDNSASESAKKTAVRLNRYLRAIVIGAGVMVSFYTLGLLPLLQVEWFVIKMPCSVAGYWWGDIGGYIFYGLYFYCSIFMLQNRMGTEKKQR